MKPILLSLGDVKWKKAGAYNEVKLLVASLEKFVLWLFCSAKDSILEALCTDSFSLDALAWPDADSLFGKSRAVLTIF